jgi:hypothetical protein
MPRQKTTASIEAKIKQAEDEVVKTKGKYDLAISELEALMKERNISKNWRCLRFSRKAANPLIVNFPIN